MCLQRMEQGTSESESASQEYCYGVNEADAGERAQCQLARESRPTWTGRKAGGFATAGGSLARAKAVEELTLEGPSRSEKRGLRQDFSF